jgi:hypothetical protein
VCRDPGGAVVGGADGFNQSLSAAVGVLTSYSSFAVSLDVFALLTPLGVAVCIEVTLVDS